MRSNKDDIVKRSIYADLVLTGTPVEMVYKAMGLSRASWCNRMNDPDSFRAGEIKILRNYVSKDTVDMITT